jgi:hypothetical protein
VFIDVLKTRRLGKRGASNKTEKQGRFKQRGIKKGRVLSKSWDIFKEVFVRILAALFAKKPSAGIRAGEGEIV